MSISGPDPVQKFLKRLNKQWKVMKVLKNVQPMIITPTQEAQFQQATHCHICNKPLPPIASPDMGIGEQPVRDHDHINGLYRGAAHSTCNINYSLKNAPIPVFFHNLNGYDTAESDWERVAVAQDMMRQHRSKNC
jgi:hypothetical protein